MANLQYSSDIVNDILFRGGEQTDGTSDYEAKALEYLNRAYQALWMGGREMDPQVNEDWYWLLSSTPSTLTLSPAITTGTVQVTNNSTAIIFSSAPAASVAGYHFRSDDVDDIFRISTHVAASVNATLDSVYTAENNLAAGYKLMKFEYTLPSDVLRLVSPMKVYRDSRDEIQGISLMELERRWPLRVPTSGVPRSFAQLSETSVRFSHYGSDTANDYIRADFYYLRRPADLTDSGSEEPLVPRQYRSILSDYGTSLLMSDKNDNRAEGTGLLARAGLKAMVIENRHRWGSWSRDSGRIFSRQADMPEYYYPLRTESGIIIG